MKLRYKSIFIMVLVLAFSVCLTMALSVSAFAEGTEDAATVGETTGDVAPAADCSFAPSSAGDAAPAGSAGAAGDSGQDYTGGAGAADTDASANSGSAESTQPSETGGAAANDSGADKTGTTSGGTGGNTENGNGDNAKTGGSESGDTEHSLNQSPGGNSSEVTDKAQTEDKTVNENDAEKSEVLTNNQDKQTAFDDKTEDDDDDSDPADDEEITNPDKEKTETEETGNQEISSETKTEEMTGTTESGNSQGTIQDGQKEKTSSGNTEYSLNYSIGANSFEVSGGTQATIADILSNLGYSIDDTTEISIDNDSVDGSILSIVETERGPSLKDLGPFSSTTVIVYVNGEKTELKIVDPVDIQGSMSAAEVEESFDACQDSNVKLIGDVDIVDDESIVLSQGTHELYLNGYRINASANKCNSLFVIGNGVTLNIYGGADASSDGDGAIIGNTSLFRIGYGGTLNFISGTATVEEGYYVAENYGGQANIESGSFEVQNGLGDNASYTITFKDANGNSTDFAGGSEIKLADVLTNLGYEVNEYSVITFDPDSVDRKNICVTLTQNGYVITDNGPFAETEKSLVVYLNGTAVTLEVTDDVEVFVTDADELISVFKRTDSTNYKIYVGRDIKCSSDDTICINSSKYRYEIYMQGHKLYCNNRFEIANGCYVKVYNGTLDIDIISIGPGSTLDLTAVTMERCYIYGEGTLNINDVYFYSAYTKYICNKYINIYGGTLHLMNSSLADRDDAVVNIYGGDFYCTILEITKGTYNIYGGTASGWDSRPEKYLFLKIHGGTVNVYDGAKIDVYDITAGTTNIYGGLVRLLQIYDPGIWNFNGGTVNVFGGQLLASKGWINPTNASLYVYGGTISGTISARSGGQVHICSSKASFGIVGCEGGRVYVHNATVGGTAYTVENAYISAYSGTSTGNYYIHNGATVTIGYSSTNNIYIYGGATATVNVSTSYIKVSDNGTLYLNNYSGKVEVLSTATAAYIYGNVGTIVNAGTTYICSGSIGAISNTGTLDITGGYFVTKPDSSWVHKGYRAYCVDGKGNYKYQVTEIMTCDLVVPTNTNDVYGFATIKEALEYASLSDTCYTIRLNKDVANEAVEIATGKNIILDLCGNNLNAESEANVSAITVNGTLEIIDSGKELEDDTTKYGVISAVTTGTNKTSTGISVTFGGKLTVKGGTVIGGTQGLSVENGTAEIAGGYITVLNYASDAAVKTGSKGSITVCAGNNTKGGILGLIPEGANVVVTGGIFSDANVINFVKKQQTESDPIYARTANNDEETAGKGYIYEVRAASCYYVTGTDGDYTYHYYAAIQDAVDAASSTSDNTTIYIVRDITGEESVQISGKNITIDLKGYDFTSIKNRTAITLSNSASLVITDTSGAADADLGTIKTVGNSDYAIVVKDSSTFTLSNGKVSGVNNAIQSTDSTIIISGGSVSAVNGCGIEATNSSVIVTAGSVDGSTAGIEKYGSKNSKNITVSGGTVKGVNQGIRNEAYGDIVISGGVISATGSDGIGIYNLYTGTASKLSVSESAVVIGTKAAILNSENSSIVTEITGGTIGDESTNEGIVNNGNGNITISGGTISGITNAISKTAKGDLTVTGGKIISTGTSGNGINLSSSSTGTAKFSGTAVVYGNTAILNSGAMTVEIDGATVGNDSSNSSTDIALNNQAGGNITVKSGSVSGTSKGIFNKGTGSITISGGTVAASAANGTALYLDSSSKGAVEISKTGTAATLIQALRGIFNAGSGNISISDATVSGADTASGIGLEMSENAGGEITIDGSSITGYTAIKNVKAPLVIKNSSTIGNDSTHNGIINIGNAAVTVNSSTVKGSDTAISKDGIGTLTIDSSTVSGDKAIDLASGNTGEVKLSESTIEGVSYGIYNAGNADISISGGSVNATANSGTGIFNKTGSKGTLTVANLTSLSGNTAVDNEGSMTVVISGSNVGDSESSASKLCSTGIKNGANGSVSLTSCNVLALKESGTAIDNFGKLSIDTCTVKGTLNGISTSGTADVKAGTVEGTSGTGIITSGSTKLTGGTAVNGALYGISTSGTSSTLDVNGGTVKGTDTTNGVGINVSNGTTTIKNVTVTGAKNGIETAGTLTVDGSTTSVTGTNNTGIAVTGGTTTVNDGTITGKTDGISVNNAALTVAGGTINGTNNAIKISNCAQNSINIGKGTITGANALNIENISSDTDVIVNVSGGDFSGKLASTKISALDFTGGTFVNNEQDTETQKAYVASCIKDSEHYYCNAVDKITFKVVCGKSDGTVYVAKVGDNWYTETELSSAITDAITSNKSLILTNDITTPIAVAEGKTLSLDLNGHSITVEEGPAIDITGGTLNLYDSSVAKLGEVKSNSGDAISVEKGTNGTAGNLNVSDVTVSGKENGIHAIDNSVVTVNSGNIKAETGSAVKLENNATLTVNGGELSGKVAGINNSGSGVITVSGGTVMGEDGIVNSGSGSITVSGSDTVIEGTTGSGIKLTADNTGKVTISGGSVSGAVDGIENLSSSESITGNIIEVSGGSVIGISGSGINNAEGSKGNTSISGGSVSGKTGITNNGSGNVTVSGGDVTGSENGIVNKTGTITVTGDKDKHGTVTGTTGTGIKSDTGTVEVSGTGKVSGKLSGIEVKDAKLNISGGTIEGTGKEDGQGNGIKITGNADVNISGGAITGSKSGSGIIAESAASGTIDVTGGKITGNTGITNNGSTAITINGTDASVEGSTNGIVNSGAGTVNVQSGTVEGKEGAGIVNSGTALNPVTVSGGTIKGSTDGIASSSGEIVVSGGAITGSSNNGLTLTGGSALVNGGTITGKVDGINSTSAPVTITGNNTKVSGETGNGVSISGAKLTVGNNGDIPEISGGTNGILATNNGDNKAEVVINSGKVTGTASGIDAEKSTVTVNGGEINAENGIKLGNDSTLNVVSGTVTGTKYGIYNNNNGTTGTINVSGGTVSGADAGIYNNGKQGSIGIEGGTITGGTDGTGIINTENSDGDITISGAGKVEGKTGISNGGKVNITVNGENCGVYGTENGIESTDSSSGNITLTNGTVSGTSGTGIVYKGTGTVAVQGGAVTGKTNGINQSSGILNVSGGTVNGTDGAGITISGENTNANISGGTVEGSGTNGAGIVQNGGALTITGGSTNIKGTKTGLEISGGTTNVQGGTIASTSDDGNGIEIKKDSDVNISGGTISGGSNGIGILIDQDVKGTNPLDISGGTISGGNSGITNNGDAAINVSAGTINGTGTNGIGIDNNGKGNVNVSDGKVTGTDSGISNSSEGNVNVSSTGEVTGGVNGIENSGSGDINVSGQGAVTGGTNGIVNSGSGDISVKSGTVTGTSGSGINLGANSTGKVAVSGGSVSGGTDGIKNESTKPETDATSPRISISGEAAVTGTNGSGINNAAGSEGTTSVQGGTISGNNGISSSGNNTVNVINGTITGTESGLVGNGTNVQMKVSGGEISGTKKGIELSSGKLDVTGGQIGCDNTSGEGAVYIIGGEANLEDAVLTGNVGIVTKSQSTGDPMVKIEDLTIGTQENPVKTGIVADGGQLQIGGNTKIKASETGVKNSSGTVYLNNADITAPKAVEVINTGKTSIYDGTYNGTVTSENSNNLGIDGGNFSDKPQMDEKIYNVIWDEEKKVWNVECKYEAKIELSDGTIVWYETIDKAVENSQTGDKIILTKSVNRTVEIPEDKNIVLDLNGKKISSSNGSALVVKGIADVQDNSPQVNGSISGIPTGIRVEGADSKLTVSSAVSISGENEGILCSGGKIIVNNGTISGKTAISAVNNSNITVNNGTINGDTYGIYSDSSIVNINGGTVNGKTGLYAVNSTATLDGGTINGTENEGVYLDQGKLVVKSGKVNGKTNGIYTKDAIVEISGGVVTGTEEYGIDSTNSRVTITNEGKVSGEKSGIRANDSAIDISGNAEVSGKENGIEATNTEVTVDGGTVKGTNNGIYATDSLVTVNGGKIEATDSSTGVGINAVGSEVEVNNGYIAGTTGIKADKDEENDLTSKVTIFSGIISGTKNGLDVLNGTTLAVVGGTIEGSENGIHVSDSEAALEGGNVTGKLLVEGVKSDVFIYGGTYNGDISAEDKKLLTITAGNFSSPEKAKEYMMDGCNYDEEHGTITNNFVCILKTGSGTSGCNSIADALEQVTGEGTIILLKNCNEKLTINDGQNVTLNIKGRKLMDTLITVNENAVFKLEDQLGTGSVRGETAAIVVNGGDVSAEEVDISGNGEYIIWVKSGSFKAEDIKVYDGDEAVKIGSSTTVQPASEDEEEEKIITSGDVTISNSNLTGANNCIELISGKLNVTSTTMYGSNNIGIKVEDGEATVSDSGIIGHDGGISVANGKVQISDSVIITENQAGLTLTEGNVSVVSTTITSQVDDAVSVENGTVVIEGESYIEANTSGKNAVSITGTGSVEIKDGLISGGLDGESTNLKISGGQYTDNPTAFVCSGYEVSNTTDDKYKYEVVKSAPVIINENEGTNEVTIKSDNPNAVTIEAVINGQNAVVEKIDAAEIEAIISKLAGNENVVVDFSPVKGTIASAELPASFFKDVEDSSSKLKKADTGIAVELTIGRFDFDSKAVKAINEASADSKSVKIVIERISEEKLDNEQKDAVDKSNCNIVAYIDAYVLVNDNIIFDFNNGNLSLTLKKLIYDGYSADELKLYVLSDSGEMTEVNFTINENGEIVVENAITGRYVLTTEIIHV